MLETLDRRGPLTSRIMSHSKMFSFLFSSQYSRGMGVLYICNIMLGSGVLTLPKLFAETGWLLGLVGLSVVAIASYCTGTFVVETLFIHRLLQRHQQDDNQKRAGKDENVMDNEGSCNKITSCHPTDPNNVNIIENFHIEQPNNQQEEVTKEEYKKDAPMKKNEERGGGAQFGHLCQMFFPNFLYILFYVTLCLQCYGVISIDFVILSKSLTSITCDESDWETVNATTTCMTMEHLTVHQVYLVMLSIIVALIGPFVFFTISTTKIIQLLAFIYRFLSFACMTVIGMTKVGNGTKLTPKLAVFSKLPNFVGAVLYILGFHVSLPAIIHPIAYKQRLKPVIIIPFVIVLALDVLLVMSACYSYPVEEIQDIYTLNFTHPPPLKYLLQLFPVICLSSSAPITGIVLRENLKKLILKKNEGEYSFVVRRIAFPLLVLIPPVSVAYVTDDVGMLVGYIGTCTGGILLYVFPALLVYYARRTAMRTLGNHYSVDNESPFSHNAWVVLILVWYLISTSMMVYYRVTS